MITRRDFIKTMSLLSGAVLAPVRWLGKWAGVQPAQMEELSEEGELYAGFVLLPEGAKVPDFVQDEKLGMPNMCGVGKENGSEVVQAVYSHLDSANELVIQTRLPIYTLELLPEGLQPSGASILSHKTGELYCGTVIFEAYNDTFEDWHTALSIEARVDFPHPVPLWTSQPVEEGGFPIFLEKVDYLPG